MDYEDSDSKSLIHVSAQLKIPKSDPASSTKITISQKAQVILK